jgi:hypothetical protein
LAVSLAETSDIARPQILVCGLLLFN